MSLKIRFVRKEFEELNEYQNCNGCGTECEMIEFNKDRSCPCTQCLVKIMCENICEGWEKWYEHI